MDPVVCASKEIMMLSLGKKELKKPKIMLSLVSPKLFDVLMSSKMSSKSNNVQSDPK